ncbi:MAG: hypothetical protein WAX69_04760 [Victivallales bacterium]
MKVSKAVAVSTILIFSISLSGMATDSDETGLKAKHSGSKILGTPDFFVEVMDPSSTERYHRGVRFTPVAAVLRVVARENEYLLNPVEHDSCLDVAGLMAEFDPVSPLGFEEAKIGEGFVKVGVGVLRKNREKYAPRPPYEVMELAETKTTWEKDSVKYKQTCHGINGYGYELKSEMKIEPQNHKLVIEWELTNTGTRQLETWHYSHNCFRFGNLDISDGYRLSFPYDFNIEGNSDAVEKTGRSLQFLKRPVTPLNIRVPFPDKDIPNTFELIDEKTGLEARCLTSRYGAYTTLHASKDYVCPEQFVRITLPPGQTAKWTREYVFAGKTE